MKIGLIGAGSMATALARGWQSPVVVSDPNEARARELVAEMGGTVAANNVEVAESVDVVVLCHKPAQLAEVAQEIDGVAKSVVSILGSVTVSEVRAAYPASPAYRVLPNLPVELRKGVLCWPLSNGIEGNAIRDHFAELGRVIELDEAIIEQAMALSSNAPGFLAFVVEAFVEAGVAYGLSTELATELVTATMVGTSALLDARDGDAGRLRREVCSPGGSTERGVAALEAAGLRQAFLDAVEAVVAPK